MYYVYSEWTYRSLPGVYKLVRLLGCQLKMFASSEIMNIVSFWGATEMFEHWNVHKLISMFGCFSHDKRSRNVNSNNHFEPWRMKANLINPICVFFLSSVIARSNILRNCSLVCVYCLYNADEGTYSNWSN